MSGRRNRRAAEQSAPLRAADRATVELLELLTYTAWPLTIDELREHGVSAPAQAIYELQLAGYEIDRVAIGGDGSHHSSGYQLRSPVIDAWGPAEPPTTCEPGRRNRSGQAGRAARKRRASPITEVRP